MTRTRASQFQAATDTLTVQGPEGPRIQLTYTPGAPGAPNTDSYGWIPPGPPDSMLSGESRLSAWSSPYRLTTWTADRAPGQGYLAGTIATTLDGTYAWTTSSFSRRREPTLYRTLLHWANTAHYPSVITATHAVHEMIRQSHLRHTQTPQVMLAWHSASGAMLTPGIPGTGEAPWYLFTTTNHGKSWQLTHVSTIGSISRRTGFPATSPSDALVALAMISTRTLWIAQTINCMSGPEPSGGTVTLAESTTDGRAWHRIANRIQELGGYCPIRLQLAVAALEDLPTIRLIEHNATGTQEQWIWTPVQWSP